jgi:hypothetical protein
MQLNTCKLTGRLGPLVKAHIIPAVFTKRVWPSVPLMECNGISRPSRRWTGWYDRGLVCQSGEDILARYDDYGYKTLDGASLLVRGKKTRLELVAEQVVKIESVDINRFRLFGLSMLWRSAASNIPACDDINLPDDVTRDLRDSILDGNPRGADYHPMWLSCFDQVDTENVSPSQINFEGEKFARFFLDGAIMYVGYSGSSKLVSKFGRLFVGAAEDVYAIVVPYAGSDQERQHFEVANQTFSVWGDPWNKGKANG